MRAISWNEGGSEGWGSGGGGGGEEEGEDRGVEFLSLGATHCSEIQNDANT